MLEAISSFYESLIEGLPNQFSLLPPLFLFTIAIALYSIFVWIFYRFLARRDIIELNLKKYNIFEHAWLIQIFAVIFYIIEFLIVIPFVITVWFAFLAILLIVLAKEQTVSTVLLISGCIIAAIRISSYFKEDLSRDLAKMFPFTLLGIAILTPGFFDVSATIQKLYQIPPLLHNIVFYSLFIASIEIILRLFYLIYSFTYSGGKEEEAREEKE